MHKTSLNKGSALLTALFVITLITIIATAISVRIRNDIEITQLIETTDRLYLASQAVSIWAMDRLRDPKQELGKMNLKTGAVLSFPANLQRIYPNITITGQLFDLQGRFNLNTLADTQYQAIFYTLLGNLHIGNTSAERKELNDSVVYWITPPKITSTQDEWQDKYAKQKPTYFPSHMPMYHPSELRLVYGFSAKYYQKLAPFIATLPEATAININTAPKPVLAALSTGLKDSDLDHILQVRSSKPFKNPQELAPIIQKYHIPNEILTVESHYFLAVATVQANDLSMKIYVMLKRQKDEETGIWQVNILTQSINTP
ncbi:MAG: type II secretion system minor pseudopilin GspK [Gammaproteobacteria bacterium]